jgi:HlyD family secretion protein
MKHTIHPDVVRTRRRAWLPLTIAPLLVLVGCSKQEADKEPVVSVQTTLAQRATISQTVAAEGVIYPLEQATISPKITAPITELKVHRGSHVKKGQLLAKLENKDLAGQAEATQGTFEQADASYKTSVDATIPQQVQKAQLDADVAKAAYEVQLRVYNSRKELFDQGALPQRDLDSAAVALAQARGANEVAQKLLADLQRLGKEQAIKSAQGSRLSAEGTMRSAEAQLSYSMIRSPIDGVVTDRPLYAGDLATANQPILTVMNLSRLIAKSHIPQTEAATLKGGDAAQLKVPGLDEPVNGKVTLVSPALDPGSTTIEVWVEASKPNPALKPGMTVQLRMTSKTVKDAIVVPASAVFKNPEGQADYVVIAGADQKAHWQTVELGVRNADNVQVVTGLNAGAPVITSGGYALPDNTKIKIQAPEEQAKGDEKADKAGDSSKAGAKEKDDKD